MLSSDWLKFRFVIHHMVRFCDVIIIKMRKLKSISHDYSCFLVNSAFQWNVENYFQPWSINITILHYQWLKTWYLSQCTWFYSSTHHALFLASLHFHFSARLCVSQRLIDFPRCEICLCHVMLSERVGCLMIHVKRVFLLTRSVSVFSPTIRELFSNNILFISLL